RSAWCLQHRKLGRLSLEWLAGVVAPRATSMIYPDREVDANELSAWLDITARAVKRPFLVRSEIGLRSSTILCSFAQARCGTLGRPGGSRLRGFGAGAARIPGFGDDV